MAGRPYSLGGFSGQLTADELERAIAAASGAPVPPAPAEPAPDMSVQRAPGRPMQQIRAYGDADLADQNAQIALAGRTGEEESAAAAERARLRGEQAQSQRATNDRARADTEDTRAHKKGLRDEQDKLLDDMRAHLEPPSRSAGERLWGVLGGVLAMASHGRAAPGVALISQLATSGREERWAQAQASRSALYQAVTKGIDLDNATEEQQLEVARRMGAADALYWDAVIESEKEKGMGAAAKREAEGAQLILRQKARSALRQDAERDAAAEAAAKKAAGAAQRDALKRFFWGLSEEQLAAMPDSELGEVGQQVRADKTKQRQAGMRGDIDIAKGLQETGGDVQPGSQTPSGRVIERPDVYKQLSATERKSLSDSDAATRELATNIDDLLKLRARHGFLVGVPGSDSYNTAQAINSKIQLAMKKADTLGTLDKGSVEFLDKMTGDPNSWFSAPEAKLKSIKELAVNDAEERAARAGLSAPNRRSEAFQGGVAGGLQGGGGAPDAGTTLIPMVGPGGKVIRAHPSKVEKLRKMGFSEQAVAGGSFIRQPAQLGGM